MPSNDLSMPDTTDSSIHQRFSTRWGLLFSVLGVAVGTGNIWRFPRIAAQNGGEHGAGAFLVSWVLFLFLWSIPLIVAEYAIGRRSRKGPVEALAAIAGRNLTWTGGFVAFVSAAITFYYAVVVGWCLYYLFQMVTAPLPQSTEAAFSTWNRFQSSAWPSFFHALVLVLGVLAIWRGIRSIERLNRWMIPTLLAIVLISLVRALTLPGSSAGVAYLFTPDWEQLLQPRIWLEALSQNAWDTGAGWGLFLTYAAYMQRQQPIVKTALLTGIGNNLVSLLAALIVFGTVFSILQTEMALSRQETLEILRSSGPASTGLTLIWMPQLFARMSLGTPLSILFFLGLTLAGFSSLMAMLELQARVLVDAGLTRSRAVLLVSVVSYLLGIPSALSLSFFGNQDFVWGVALMISGALVAFAVTRYGCDRLRGEELPAISGDLFPGRWWDASMKYIVPVGASLLLLWWLSLSATVYAPDQWHNPLLPYSVMTCLVQWGTVLTVLWLVNRRLSRRR